MAEQSQRAYELRQYALSEANKCSQLPASMSMANGATTFLKPETVIERAKAYYEFLKGTTE